MRRVFNEKDIERKVKELAEATVIATKLVWQQGYNPKNNEQLGEVLAILRKYESHSEELKMLASQLETYDRARQR